MCCRALNAKCKACEAGMTVEEFCSYPINAHVQGCGGKEQILFIPYFLYRVIKIVSYNFSNIKL